MMKPSRADARSVLLGLFWAGTTAALLVAGFCAGIEVVTSVILLGAGGVVAAAELGFWPIWTSAVCGDWISYWIGYCFSDRIGRVWPLSRYPELLPRGQRFFEKWGALGVFFGRFVGPLRAVMPIIAGICGMRQLPFQAANIASALLWGTLVLSPGVVAARWFV